MANNKDKTTVYTSLVPPPIVFMRPINPGLSISVSKKNFKTAVARNKARRLVKEAVRVAAKEENKSLSGITLQINAQKSILDVQFQSLVELIKKAIK